jgi:hypothetical protein
VVFCCFGHVTRNKHFYGIVASKAGPKRGRERRDKFTRPGPKRGPENQENERKFGKYKKSFILGP